ncbi:MAG TPA: hypothetical protein VMY35_10220, partial [Phycisphaerae bacterium]|nr:hypothetical protein [Phycisphaerae bacterium]
MNESVRTLLAVVILTAVVWVWADLELAKEDSIDVPVEVTVPPDFVVRSIRPAHLTVKFKGPKGEIEALRKTPEALVCRLALTGSEPRAGRLVLRAREGFAHWEPYRLSVLEITDDENQVPDGEILVDVDRLVRLRVPVKVAIPGYTVAGQPAVEPAEVTAVVAESD